MKSVNTYFLLSVSLNFVKIQISFYKKMFEGLNIKTGFTYTADVWLHRLTSLHCCLLILI